MKLSRIPAKEVRIKCNFALHGKTVKVLDAYHAYCEKVSGVSFDRQDLVDQILSDFMAGDRDFQRALPANEPSAG